MEQTNSKLQLILKGMAMGIAEVIPGVSGGTIAFITGIYETLLNAIKSLLGPEVIRAFRKGGISEAWSTINGTFLFFLLLGMAIGIIAGVFGVSILLEAYPVLIWAFFFGLIIASAIYIGRQVSHWQVPQLIGLVLAIILAYWITIATPAQGTSALWMVFLAGSIAISALILPGISGSFILLLMGMYTVILPEVKNALSTFDPTSLVLVAVFALGCLFGLATFARALSWTFKHFKDTTLAILTGFMIGSLNKIWPWRNILSTRIDSGGEEVPFLEKSVLPGQFEGETFLVLAILMMVIGFVVVFLFEKIDRKVKQ
jgi:putative membrane protein